MSYLVYPSGQASDAFELCAAIDVSLGYPRQHTEAEVTRHGRGPHAPIESVRTETHTLPMQLPDGRVVVSVDEVVTSLHGRQVAIDVGAGPRSVTIDTSPAQSPVDLDGAIALPPRGGLVLQ